ncbi:MAG: ATP-binding cassette domain-containing protein [Streptococcaceae bacterium]|jgi:ABC-type multidrug transport system fused ATPase/permease subunit|nr:ATP-binding cassette domain-containing protein [Streptococcaceae bacterium]
MRAFIQLWWYFKDEKKGYGLGLFALFCVALTHLIPPIIIGKFIDDIVRRDLTVSLTALYLLILLLTAGVEYFFRYFWIINLRGAAFKLEKVLRARLFGHFLRMDRPFFQRNRTGDLMAHATNDLNAIRDMAGTGILTLADSLMSGGTTIVAMLLAIDWRLTLIAILPMPLLALVAKMLGDRIHSTFDHAQATFSEMNDKVQEGITGVKAIKSFGEEAQDIKNFDGQLRRVDKAFNAVNFIDSLYDPLMDLIVGASYSLTIFLGGYYVLHHTISLGQLVSFFAYLGNLVWPMFAIGMLFNIMERGSASYDRVDRLLKQKSESKTSDGTLKMPAAGDLHFAVDSFEYPGETKHYLEAVDFTLKKGEVLGLVGRTGSGKSSIIKLLIREYDDYAGHIDYAGHNIKDYQLDEYLPSVGYVPQEHFLFSTTVRDNIRFARMEAAQAEVELAAKAAGIHEDILGFAEGYDTMVGERGVSLSGGQKQRLSIARAILIEPKLLILDDALSAVDAKTESRILTELSKIRANSVTLIVSHRLSSVMDADEIIVLDEGKVAERGNHAELSSSEGWYAQMWQMQQIESKLESQSPEEIMADENVGSLAQSNESEVSQ